MTARRNRTRSPARKRALLEPKPLILVVCEGEKTEPSYFSSFKSHYKISRITIRTVPGAGVPLSVVSKARDLKNSADKAAATNLDENLKYDAVWAVFDVDEHPELKTAIQLARDNRIELAISNPCFELWLLLHHRDPPGIKHRHAVQKLLKKVMGEYDKGVDFASYALGYKQAVRRAELLGDCDLARCEPGPNPSTEVYRLTESILEET